VSSRVLNMLAAPFASTATSALLVVAYLRKGKT
jgi:hypothetical protein